MDKNIFIIEKTSSQFKCEFKGDTEEMTFALSSMMDENATFAPLVTKAIDVSPLANKKILKVAGKASFKLELDKGEIFARLEGKGSDVIIMLAYVMSEHNTYLEMFKEALRIHRFKKNNPHKELYKDFVKQYPEIEKDFNNFIEKGGDPANFKKEFEHYGKGLAEVLEKFIQSGRK